MGIKVNLNGFDQVRKLFSEGNLARGLAAATSQAGMELTDYSTSPVPRLHGDLRDSATPGTDHVDFNTSYAAVQFNGGYTTKDGRQVKFVHYTTPGTGPHWDKALQDNDQKMARIRAAYLKGLEL